MPNISYVCMSDMHLGEEDGLLTNLKTGSTDTESTQPSPVMVQLVECLRELISKNEEGKKPILILNGDILELALTTTNHAAMVFERFIELIMPADKELFERIIYIPGNHDHHIWELARETQYVNYIIKPEMTNPDIGKRLPIPWHTTNMFVENDPNPVPSYFLTKLVNRFPRPTDCVITTVYPNFGLFIEDSQKCVIFHHGHFIEPLYQLMSNLRNLILPNREKPRHIWDIEAENFAWIDFFWSTMGRSGEVGKDVELIYEKMHDKVQIRRLFYTFIDNFAKKKNWPRITTKILGRIIFHLLKNKIPGFEKKQMVDFLSQDAKDALKEYMNTPLREQILAEGKDTPNDVTFVFGHTHKPFQEKMDVTKYPEKVKVYNTGGWVVNDKVPRPLHGGAIILVDDDLDTVSLRMYNQEADPEKYSIRVEQATHAGEEKNPLYYQIQNLVKSSEDLWQEFSKIAADTVEERIKHFRDRLTKD